MSTKLITIDSSKIDSDLLNFPLLFFLNSVAFSVDDLAAINADPLKVAFIDSSGTTQYFAELESTTTTETRYHVKIPSILSSSDTQFIFEFGLVSDNTAYIGETGATAAQSVWSNGYSAVYHMAQDPSGGTDAIKDSVGTAHITPDGSYSSSQLIHSDTYGYGIQSTQSNVSCKTAIAHDFSSLSSGFTIESLQYTPNLFYAYSRTVDIGNSVSGSLLHGPFSTVNSTTAGAILGVWGDDAFTSIVTGIGAYDFIATYLDSGSIYGIINGTLDGNSNAVTIANLSAAYVSFFIAGSGHKASTTAFEIRISSVIRTKAWIDATESSLRNEVIKSIESCYYLSGTIKDTADNPISGATIKAINNSEYTIEKSTLSTSSGAWTINYIPNGKFDVIGEFDGYESDIVNGIDSVEMPQ